jgi:hypothetical protein
MNAQTLLELLRARERNRPPLVCYHGDSLPVTPDEAISAALASGRPVVHVRFVASDGNGHPADGVTDTLPGLDAENGESAVSRD